MRSLCCWWAAGLVAASAAAGAPIAAMAAEPPSIVVILDFSRSMWAPLEGTKASKYVTARDAMRAGLSKLPASTRVGIAAFGHRRSECNDAELLRPPEPIELDSLMAPVEPLTPRGTGPLSLVVREAAKFLPKDGSARSIVLVHDDSDNCSSELCTVAGELSSAGIAAYVVGLGTKAADLGRMACLPQLTGGRHFNALNVEQVSAYVDEALGSASRSAAVAAPAAAARQGPIVPPEPLPATGPTALHLRALPAPNTAPLNVPLSWTVAAADRPDVALFEARAPNPIVPIAPGRYVVEAREGTVAAKQTVEVRGNRPTAVTVVLNAGSARVRALVARATRIVSDAVVTLSDTGGTLLHASRTGEIEALLPAGRYVARVEIGLVRAEATLTVGAGRQAQLDIPLDIARLDVTTTGREAGSPPEAVVLSLSEDDPDAPLGRRELARSAAQQARFVMPPGPYYVVARQGTVEVRERVTVAAGGVKRLAIDVVAGRLALVTRSGLIETPAEHASYTVARVDGPSQEPITTILPAPTLALPAGRYRVEGRYGLMGVQTVGEVEVRAGETVQLVLEPPVAVLRMRLAGAGPGETWWEVFDEAGRGLWIDGQATATAHLLAGRYRVRVEARGKRHERAVELRAGETRDLDIAAD